MTDLQKGTTTMHRSAQEALQSGDVHDFHEAMKLLVQQQKEEVEYDAQILRRTGKSSYDWAQHEEFSWSIKHVENTSEVAKAIYEEYVSNAIQKTAGYMRQISREDHNPLLADIADALESGNYFTLSL